MAGEDLGSVYYTVDADTSGVLKVKNDVDKTVNSVESGLKKVDVQMSKTAKSVKTGVAGMGRSAGQAGIQLQQFVGQIQGGQSAMLAFSQQSADLGFVLGAPLLGAIAGISASIVGILVPSLLDSSNGMEELEKGIEKVKAAMTLSIDGIANYSEEMQKLRNISEELLNIRLNTLLAEQNAILAKIPGTAKNAVDAFNGLNTSQELFGEKSEAAFRSFLELSQAVKSFDAAPSAQGADAIGDALERAAKAGINTTEAGRELSNQLIKLISQYKEGRLSLEQLNEALEDSNKITAESAKNVDRLVDSVKAQADTLGFSKRQLALYAAEQEGATEEEKKAINVSFDKIEAYEKEVKIQKERKDALIATDKALESLFRKEEAQAQAQAERDKAKASRRSDVVTGQVEGLADSSDPIRQIESQREKQLAIVREYEQLETAEHQVAVDARKAIDDEYNAKLSAAQEARFVAQSESNALLIEGINSLGDTASSVLTGMLTQTLDIKSAMLGLANSILNSAVNSIIQMGLEYVKSAAIGASADQALAATRAATQATTSATHTAAVAATVAELTSLAAAGAFAATAAIPIVGPAAAPAAASLAASATGALGAPALAAAPVAGMRLYGGSTAPNSLYKVTEDGRPEMFSDGRDSFLMTGSRGGGVSSNGDLGKSEPVNIVVNNNAPNSRASASYDDKTKTATIIINEIGKQFRENSGPAFDGLIAGTSATGRAT